MAMRDSEFVDQHKLKTELKRDCTVHTILEANPNPRLRRIEKTETWSRIEELGQGGSGIVYLEQEAEGALRAVKRVRKSADKRDDHDSLRELFSITMLSKNTANFPAFYGWFDDAKHIYIAMEYFPLGDLQQCVTDMNRTISEDEAKMICYQIALALEAIHERSITHRDLKPNNVFVVETGPDWHVKLGDFGISKHVRHQVTAMHTVFMGPFVAPEVRKLVEAQEGEELVYTSAVDIWALGCLVYWLITQSKPFPGRSVREYMQTGDIPDEMRDLLHISRDGLDFIATSLELDPTNRPTATDVFGLSWLNATAPATSTSEMNVQRNASRVPATAIKLQDCDRDLARLELTSVSPADLDGSFSDIDSPAETAATRIRYPQTQFGSTSQLDRHKSEVLQDEIHRPALEEARPNERLLLSQFACLYEWRSEIKAWKSRGFGLIEFFKHSLSGNTSIFMRDLITKIVITNHYVEPDMNTEIQITPVGFNWIWTTFRDFSHGEPEAMRFKINFASGAGFQNFWDTFRKAQNVDPSL